MKTDTKYFLGALLILTILQLTDGEFMSGVYGYPIGIKKIDRAAYEIAPINWEWARYPEDNKTSATQILIGEKQPKEPKYYAKKIFMVKGLWGQDYEIDRYFLRMENEKQINLVFKWLFEDNELAKTITYIEKVTPIDLSIHCYDWFDDSELIEEISYKKADSIRIALSQ